MMIVRVSVVTGPAVVRESALIGLFGAVGKVSVALTAGESAFPTLCGTAAWTRKLVHDLLDSRVRRPGKPGSRVALCRIKSR